MPNWILCLVLTGILSSAALGKPVLAGDETQGVVYQAEENSSVTPTWILPVESTADLLGMDLISMERRRRIYRYDSRAEAEPYADEGFKGRLQCDGELDLSGRVRCVLTDLRLNDTGSYLWTVEAGGRRHQKTWQLVVKASLHEAQEETQEPMDRGRFGLHAALALVLLVTAGLSLRYVIGSVSRSKRSSLGQSGSKP